MYFADKKEGIDMAFIKRKKEQMHQNNIVYKKNRLQSILLFTGWNGGC